MADKAGNICGIRGEMFLEQKATVQILTVLHCPFCAEEGANDSRSCADSPECTSAECSIPCCQDLAPVEGCLYSHQYPRI